MRAAPQSCQGALPGFSAQAAPAQGARTDADTISPDTIKLADYVAETLDRELPAEVVARTKLHVLDTFAAIAVGLGWLSSPEELAARYVDSLGGKPQATVIGSGIRDLGRQCGAGQRHVGACRRNRRPRIRSGPVHLGCSAVSSALATAELADRTGPRPPAGRDTRLRRRRARSRRARCRARPAAAQQPLGADLHFIAAATSAAHAASRPAPSAPHTLLRGAAGLRESAFWTRDHEHIEKAFDFGGMGARNGVMAATMVAMGFSAVDDPFSGRENIYTALADNPAPEKTDCRVLARAMPCSTRRSRNGASECRCKRCSTRWRRCLPILAVREGNIKHIRVDMPTETLRIVDNSTIPDLCLQHLVALMIVDRGAGFVSVHDAARMSDPTVLAVRKLVELVGGEEICKKAIPSRQAIVQIETTEGRSLRHHTRVVRGTAANPMEAKEIEAKALDLMAPVLGAERANELIATVRDLDRVGRVSRATPAVAGIGS
jgi:2-methylcitrate dehydratase PrpD